MRLFLLLFLSFQVFTATKKEGWNGNKEGRMEWKKGRKGGMEMKKAILNGPLLVHFCFLSPLLLPLVNIHVFHISCTGLNFEGFKTILELQKSEAALLNHQIIQNYGLIFCFILMPSNTLHRCCKSRDLFYVTQINTYRPNIYSLD